MKKFIIISISIICIILVASACGGEETDKFDENYEYDGFSLVGKWREREYRDDQYQIYEFCENGDVNCIIYSFGIEMGRFEASYTVEGKNTLNILWRGDSQKDTNHFSISENNVLFLQGVASYTGEMVLVPYDLTYNQSNESLLGYWKSNDDENEVFTFNSDYTGYANGLLGGYDFVYSTKDSNIFIAIEAIDGVKHSVEAMSYKVEGDTLTLSGRDADQKDVILTFTRMK